MRGWAKSPGGQSGAALVIVLLLIATMSIIALAISEKTALSAKRSINVRTRAEALWLATGAEALARSAIATAAKGADRMTLETPLFAAPIEFPLGGGGIVIAFADRTRCFNLNALAASGDDGGDGPDKRAAAELAALIDEVDGAGGDGVIAAIADWLDADSLQQPRGAEDDYYAGLATPYRTGSGPLADVSEVRAIAGVSRDLYLSLGRFLCVHGDGKPASINVNMLGPDDAPLLAALSGGQVSAAKAADAIRARPAGGFANVEAFWAQPAFAGVEISPEVRSRAKLTSDYVEAYAVVTDAETTINVSMLFEVSGESAPRLVLRRLERFD